MTAEEALAGVSAACLDANILIYLIEGEATLQALVRELWRAMIRRDIRVVTSDLAVGECLIGAFKAGVPGITDAYQRLFSNPDEISLCQVDLNLITSAAGLGAAQRLKLVDAIHFQSAISSGCDLFVTNDTAFRSAYGVRILQIRDLRNYP